MPVPCALTLVAVREHVDDCALCCTPSVRVDQECAAVQRMTVHREAGSTMLQPILNSSRSVSVVAGEVVGELR